MELRLSGADAFARAASAVRDAGDKHLERELRRGAVRAAGHVEDAVRDSSDDYMPRGYEQTLRAALSAKTQVRTIGKGARVTIVFSAMGSHGHARHLAQMERGELRHPVYGRTRRLRRHGKHKAVTMRNPWVVQKIRPGFVAEPGEAAMPQARQELEKAVGAVIDKLRRDM